MRRRLVDVLAGLGLLHLCTAAVLLWLWRHRRGVLAALADAAREQAIRAELLRGPAAGEGAAGPSTASADGRRRAAGE